MQSGLFHLSPIHPFREVDWLFKRTFVSAVAATLALGTLYVPMAIAGSTTAPKYVLSKKEIDLNGKPISTPMGIAANDPSTGNLTTFMPLFYLMQVLKSIGVTYTWDGHYLNITVPDSIKVDLSNVKPGNAEIKIALNGMLVATAPKLVAPDPYSHVNTTYLPIYYLGQVLKRVGITNTWDGTHWGLSLTASTPTPSGPAAASIDIAGLQVVGVGQPDALTVTVKDKDGNSLQVNSSDIKWTSSDNADAFVTPGQQFIATKPGTYTLTAAYKNISQTFKVSVYGPTTAVQLTANGSLVANGKGTQTITVTALDANGTPAQGENGTIVLSDTQGWLVASTTNGVNALAHTVSAQLKNGQGTVQVQGGIVPGLTDTVTASALSDVTPGTSVTYGSVSSTTAPQTATALQVTPVNGLQYLVANQSGNTAQFTVTVVDQSGVPMLSGTYAYNIQVSGAASYTGPTTGIYVGGQTPYPISITSKQGVTGAAVIAVSGNGVASANATVNAVIAQTPSKIQATPVGGQASFAQGGSIVFNLSGLDPNGYPSTFPNLPLAVYATNVQGLPASNLTVNGAQMTSYGVPLGSNQTITIGDTSANPDAGTYTMTIKDGSGNTWATFTVTELPGAAAKLAITANDQEVAAANPSTTLTIEYTDSYGNPAVTSAASTVTVNAVGQGSATINGQTVTSQQGVKVPLDASGRATANFTAQPYAGTTWTITATDGTLTSTPPATVSVLNTLVAGASVQVKDLTTQSPVQATAGDPLSVLFGATDTLGNSYVGTDTFSASFPTSSLVGVGGSLTYGANGYTTVSGTIGQLNGYFQSVHVGSAQTLNIQISDQTVKSARAGTAAITVLPGAFDHFAVYNTQNQLVSNNNPLTVTGGQPVQVLIRPVDYYNNAVSVATATYTVDLVDGNGNGSFRTTPSGANETQMVFPLGTSSIPMYYVNNSGSYTLSADISKLQPAHSTVTINAFTPYQSSPATNGSGTLTVTLADDDNRPVTGQATNLSATASVSGVSIGSFSETATPGVYKATVTSTAYNAHVTITVKDGSTVVGTSSDFSS